MIEKKVRNIKRFSIVLFIMYLLAAIYFLFFAELLGRNYTNGEFRYNIELFSEIKRFIIYRKQLGFAAVFLNIAGNVLVFIPVGFFIPTISKKRVDKNAIVVVIYSFLLSLAIEISQMIFKVGAFDVDDLLLNTIGGFLGVVLFYGCRLLFRKKYYR